MPAIIATACLLGLAAIVVVYGRRLAAITLTAPVRRSTPESPVEEALRLLALRYARGELTFDEYRRMGNIIKR